MKLIDNWRAELNRLWVIRWAIVGMLVSAADQVLTAFQMYIPPWVYGVGMGIVIVVRLVSQNGSAPAA